MKKTISILLCAVFFIVPILACQPTPGQEYVVNKGGDALDEKLHTTPKPAVAEKPGETADGSAAPDETEAFTARQTFPERWEERIELAEDFYLIADADIITKQDGYYPVYRTQPERVDSKQASELLTKLLGAPTASQEQVMTKEDWKEVLQAYLAEVDEHRRWIAEGRPDWGHFEDEAPTDEEVAAQSKWYMDQILAAPDAADQQEVTGYDDIQIGSDSIYELASGGKAYVSTRGSGLTVGKGIGNYPYIYDEWMYHEDSQDDDPNAKLWRDVDLPRDDAEAMLKSELSRLGFEGFTVTRAMKADLMDLHESGELKYTAGGWLFKLHRNYTDYPVPQENYEPSQLLDYADGEGFTVNSPIREESLTMLIDKNGLQYFSYGDAKQVVGIENHNVELLSFEEVKDRAAKTFRMCFPLTKYKLYDEGDTAEIYLYKMYLTTCTVYVKNGQGYYEMPCWVLFFADNGYHSDYEREMAELSREPGLVRECLFINAVDGSIIHTDLGY